MGLNKSSGNMYGWVTHAWNAIKGACPHDCSYCYMKRWGKLNSLRLDKRELKTDLGSGNFIFVGSSCDMFADDVPEAWINETLNHCYEYKNRYLFQSKNPARMFRFSLPESSVVCTTIETNRVYPDIMHNSPTPKNRVAAICGLPFERYVTIEPILDFDLELMVRFIQICEPSQVNIGADSGNNHLPEPSREKIAALIDALGQFTTIAQKRNLARLI
jgi:DNA repair photolyase